MKKLVFCLTTVFLLALTTAALADSLDFENGGGLSVTTNSLGEGGEAAFGEGFEGRGLLLDGGYGLKLGRAEGDFTASAMVRVTSGGDNRTLFFKNIGSFENENWTGVIFNGGVPTFWVREGWSKRPTAAKNVMNKWVYVVYTETGGTGRLYVDGELVSEGAAVPEPGDIYLGVTYWRADALSGGVDNVELLDRALDRDEVKERFKSRVVPVRFKSYEFPSELLVSDLDLSLVPGAGDVRWSSDRESVLTSSGVLTRPAADTEVTLTGVYGDITRRFHFTALGGSPGTNKDVVLSYAPTEADGAVLTDLSGNGNHGVIHGDLTGGNFDGGDYVDLPKGIFESVESFTLVLRLTPWVNTTDQAVFCIGGSADEYFFLNTSTPRTNLLRAAITGGGADGERDLAAAPGIKSLRFASIVITAEGTRYKMYVDGLLEAEGDLGMAVSELGPAVKSYLGKSVFDCPYFRGTIDEFTVYSSAMSGEDIYARYFKEGEVTNTPCIKTAAFEGDLLTLELSRDCMVAAVFYDGRGNPLMSEVSKVSGDSLSAELEPNGASSVELMAFDAATGELIQKYSAARDGAVSADASDGGPVYVTNGADGDAAAVVTIFSYEGEMVTAIDVCDVTLEGHSGGELPLTAGPYSRIFIKEKR